MAILLNLVKSIWRICRKYMFLHSQGYSPQCETSIMTLIIHQYIFLEPLSLLFVRRQHVGHESTIGQRIFVLKLIIIIASVMLFITFYMIIKV